MNILTLWLAAEERGFESPYWLTFRQAKSLGGSVRKGEKGSAVVYSSSFEKTEKNDRGEDVERKIPFLKQYTVFAVDQIADLPKRFYRKEIEPNTEIERIERAERFFRQTGAEIREGGSRAYYSIGSDYIQMPPIERFRDAESHAATLSHEICHWTRHASRLDRDLGRKRWGDSGYAMEELVAELGSAFLCADLKITPNVDRDHAAYISSWLTVLKNDKRAIFSAASLASKAVTFLHMGQSLDVRRGTRNANRQETSSSKARSTEPETSHEMGL
ncbi:ArdC family protein [Planctomycetota bacterium]